MAFVNKALSPVLDRMKPIRYPGCKPPKVGLLFRNKPWKGKYVTVYFPKSPTDAVQQTQQITIHPWTEYREADASTRYDYYEVSWPACGGSHAARAHCFSVGLQLAISIAQSLTLEYHGRIVETVHTNRPSKLKRKRK